MQPVQESKNNKNLYRFIVLFIAGLFAGILLTYLIVSSRNAAATGDTSTALLLAETDSLKTEFGALQSLNSDYSSILEKSNLDAVQIVHLDSLNILITRKELAFLEHLDNIEIANNNIRSSSTELLKNIVDGFRIAAKQSNAVSAIRNAVNIGNTNYSFDQNMLATMQRELRAKEIELTTTQKANRDGNTISTNQTPVVAVDSLTNNALSAQKKINSTLTATNKKLQSDILQLKKQILTISARTPVSSTTVSTSPDKYASEQIRLAEADCYMTRADANQIISNSRQRTELLQNALKILNSLSNSESDVTKKQVQARLATLKKIAANNHD